MKIGNVCCWQTSESFNIENWLWKLLESKNLMKGWKLIAFTWHRFGNLTRIKTNVILRLVKNESKEKNANKANKNFVFEVANLVWKTEGKCCKEMFVKVKISGCLNSSCGLKFHFYVLPFPPSPPPPPPLGHKATIRKKKKSRFLKLSKDTSTIPT